MKKRVLFVSTSPHEYSGAGGRTRIVNEARVLKEMGVDVLILCLVPLRRWTQPAKLRLARRNLEKDAGVKVVYLPLGPSVRGLFYAELAWNALAIFVAATIYRRRVLHCHGALATASAVILKTCGLTAVVIGDFHGAGTEELRYARGEALDTYWELRSRAAETLAARCDSCIVVSRAMAEYMAENVSRRFRDAYVVPCATTVPELRLDDRYQLRKRLGIEEKFVFVYAGSVRKYQRIERMLELFKRCLNADGNFFLVVLSNQTEEFRREIERSGIPEECFLLVSLRRDEVPSYLAAADCGLLLRDSSVVNRVASPTKFAEYLACGLPVLMEGCIGDYTELAEEMGVGRTLSPYRNDVEQVLEFSRDVRACRIDYWRRCRLVAEDVLSWQSVGKTLGRLYGHLLGLHGIEGTPEWLKEGSVSDA